MHVLASWRDFTVLLCISLTLLGVAAMSTSASSFVIVKGIVTAVGSANLDEVGRTATVTVVIQDPDRVFRIERGSAVEYAVSDDDAAKISVGSEILLLVSSHHSRAKLINQQH